MNIEIKHLSGHVLYAAVSATDVRTAVVEAVHAGAYLTGANLARANLTRANLADADLTGADLTRANLADAYLTGADLTGADLTGADLTGANLARAKNAELVIAQTSILPEGDLIGYKKSKEGYIVTLRIPATAKRSNASGRKCRAEYAEVLNIYDASGEPVEIAVSQHDSAFRYTIGTIVRPTEPFDDNRWNECASGIHFYITREEAQRNT